MSDSDPKNLFKLDPEDRPLRPQAPARDPYSHLLGSAGHVGLILTPKQRAELLDETRWSRSFDWPEIERLASHMELQSIPAGEEIFGEGEAGEYMGLIVRGRIAVLKEDSSGRRRRITTIVAGKTLGEMSLLDLEPRSATAVADADSLMMVLTRKQYGKLMDNYPRLALKLLTNLARMMSQRLRRTSGILVEFLED